MSRNGSFLPEEIISPASWRQVAVHAMMPLAILLVVMLLPYPEVMRYRNLDGDALKYRWVFSRLHEQAAPVDVALIGTSRTMVAVNDSLVQLRLRQKYGRELSVANLGVSWQGRDMAYHMTRSLLATKDCRFLILEVQESLARTGHPLFGTLADRSEILEAPLLINRQYFPNLWQMPSREVENLTRYWGRTLGLSNPRIDLSEYAYRPYYPFSHDAVPGAQEMEMLKEAFEAKKVWRALPKGLDRFEFGMPRAYLESCVRAARRADAQMIFLYLPCYGFMASPQDLDFFRENGTILTPPGTILEDAGNWYDATHLNAVGNQRVSEWLAGELAALAGGTALAGAREN